MKNKKIIICFLIMIILVNSNQTQLCLADDTFSCSIAFIKDDKTNNYYTVKTIGKGINQQLYLYYEYNFKNSSAQKAVFNVKSSDESVVKIDDSCITEFTELNNVDSGSGKWRLLCTALKIGVSDIIITANNITTTFHVIVISADSVIKSVMQSSYDEIKINWNNISECDGYSIQRGNGNIRRTYESIELVSGASVNSKITSPVYGKKSNYRVYPIIRWNNMNFYYSYSVSGSGGNNKSVSITPTKKFFQIKSIKNCNKGVILGFNWPSGAKCIDVYEGNQNSSYKFKTNINHKDVNAYTCILNPGNQKKIYMAVKYKSGVVGVSDVINVYKSKKGKLHKKSIGKKKIPKVSYQYDWDWWASTNKIYYYQTAEGLFAVGIYNKKIQLYKVDENKLKLNFVKTINIGKYKHWGGFYHGKDNKFYIAVGFNNYKEKDNKTVIKVIRYSKNWKREKACNILGKSTNMFKGIYQPFIGGNCRMSMSDGNKGILYVETCRKMYKDKDGIRHQSNIAFSIKTDKMTYKDANEVYVSHSFNQYVEFFNDDLYVLNHGDGYPRAVTLSKISDYGENSDEIEKNIFKIKGKIGNNFTGVTVGGMEVMLGNKVITCGTAMPHNYKISKVSGFKSKYRKNAYITITDFNSNKNTVKWLTKNNPKNKKINVPEAGIVKMSDNRVAVICTVVKKAKKILNYYVLDENGKLVYKKSYKNASYLGGTQPILYKGKIIWIERNKIYSIPAVY